MTKPAPEPVATLHDDGYWTPKQTEAGRRLNDQLMRAGTHVDVYTAPPLDAQRPLLLEWAVGRWRAEVEGRPLENIHRRALDDSWRQVIRYAGGDPDMLLGPAHDVLMARASGQ